MQNLLQDPDTVIQEFADAVFKQHQICRYGLNCRNPDRLDEKVDLYELLMWMELNTSEY